MTNFKEKGKNIYFLVSTWGGRYFRKLVPLTDNIPWLNFEEREVFIIILKTLRPKICLEWGAGYSTLYFPKFIGKDAKWFSVEHDIKWSEKIRRLNKKKNVEICHTPPDKYPWTDKNNDGAYSDLKNYIEFPAFQKYDLIFIDGVARKDCLKKAYELITEDGIVILHDAEREYYHEPFYLYKYQHTFSFKGRKRKIWIGSKCDKIKNSIENYNHFIKLLDKIKYFLGKRNNSKLQAS